MRPTYHVQGPLPAVLAVLAALAVSSSALPRPAPHGSGWVPSGAWSAPSYVNPWPAQPAQGWTDYSVSSVSVDPWATQVVKKKPSYASLYPWPEKPAYRSVPLHVPSAAPSYTPQHHSGGYAGWTRIPVLDEEGGNQWVAWVPEELGDFVIVRKDKLKPKKKKVEEEEEEEPEPPKPKPKKKVKTIVEEDAPEEEPPKPKKKVKTIVEEEAPEEEPPKPKKKIKTIVEDEVPPKKTTKTTVTTEEQGEPGTSVKETSTSSDTRVTKTEVIEQASTMPESVSVPAPTK